MFGEGRRWIFRIAASIVGTFETKRYYSRSGITCLHMQITPSRVFQNVFNGSTEVRRTPDIGDPGGGVPRAGGDHASYRLFRSDDNGFHRTVATVASTPQPDSVAPPPKRDNKPWT